MADIKDIAEKLVGLSSFEVIALARILAEDYGIKLEEAKDDVHLRREIPTETVKVLTMKDATTRLEIEKEYKPKQRMYVPRTIGKPCKKKFSRRK